MGTNSMVTGHQRIEKVHEHMHSRGDIYIWRNNIKLKYKPGSDNSTMSMKIKHAYTNPVRVDVVVVVVGFFFQFVHESEGFLLIILTIVLPNGLP